MKHGKFIGLFLAATTLFLTACGDSGVSSLEPPEKVAGVASRAPDYTYTISAKGLLTEDSLYPEPRGGKTYYVSASGSDSNDGLSETTPFKTVGKINELELLGGDKVLFKRDETFSNITLTIDDSGLEGNPIYFGSYGDGTAKARLFTKSISCIEFSNVSNIVIDGLECIMTAADRVNADNDIGIIRGWYSTDADFENIWIVNNSVHSSGVRSCANGIDIGSMFAWGTNGEAYPDNLLSNVYIQNNEVYDCGNFGIGVRAWLSDVNFSCIKQDVYRAVYMRDNTVYNIGQLGMFLSCCSESDMRENLLYNCASNMSAISSVGNCGMMTMACKDCAMENNVIYDTNTAGMTYDSMGIDIDWNCENITVRYNHCYDNKGSGISTMANKGGVIAYNRVESNDCMWHNQYGQISVTNFIAKGNGANIYPDHMKQVENVKIYGNLIVNDIEDKYAFSTHDEGGGVAWSGNEFYDNHIIDETGSAAPKYVFVNANTPWNSFYGNAYYSDNASFNCLDSTESVYIFGGGMPLLNGYCIDFEGWAKRDIGASLSAKDKSLPSSLRNVTLEQNGNKVKLLWDTASVWRYNVYELAFDEELSYRRLIGQTAENYYEYTFAHTGSYYFVVQPESAQGVYGEAVKIEFVVA